ncbi:MAG: DMT family transporter, partial [Solirubrobacterales bacterium]
ALIVGSLPVVAGLLAWVAGIDRPLPRRFWAAAGVGVLGVTLIAASARPHAGGGPPGELFAVGSVLSWAVYSVAAVPLIRWYGWLRAMAAAMALGAVPLCIAAILRPSGGVGTFGVEVGTALTFSLAGVVAAQVLWMQGIARVGPARAAVFTNLQPLLGALFAVLLLSEVLRWTHMIGGALILLALMLNPVRAGPEELYPEVVDGVEEEGGVPSRLLKTDRRKAEKEGTPWQMFAGSPLGRTTTRSRSRSTISRVRALAG